MEDVLRIDCFSDTLKHRVSTIYVKELSTNSPADFIVHERGSRILVCNETSPLAIGSEWTLIFQKPEATEWSLLLSMLTHLRAPRLLVVDTGVVLPPRLLSTLVSRGLAAIDTTVLLYRALDSLEQPVCSHVCFLPPVADSLTASRIVSIATALWNIGNGSGATTSEQIAKVYQELGPKGMWMVLQIASVPSMHWYQPGARDEEDFMLRFKSLSRTLGALFSAIGR